MWVSVDYLRKMEGVSRQTIGRLYLRMPSENVLVLSSKTVNGTRVVKTKVL